MVNPINVNSFAYLFDCTTVASDCKGRGLVDHKPVKSPVFTLAAVPSSGTSVLVFLGCFMCFFVLLFLLLIQ